MKSLFLFLLVGIASLLVHFTVMPNVYTQVIGTSCLVIFAFKLFYSHQEDWDEMVSFGMNS